MKKIILPLFIFGSLFLNAENFPKELPTTNFKMPSKDFYTPKDDAMAKKILSDMKNKFSDKEMKKFDEKLLKGNKDYEKVLKMKNKMNKQTNYLSSNTGITNKVNKILLKLTDLEKEAIDIGDLTSLAKYNTLQKCLLNSKSNDDINTCKQFFKENQ